MAKCIYPFFILDPKQKKKSLTKMLLKKPFYFFGIFRGTANSIAKLIYSLFYPGTWTKQKNNWIIQLKKSLGVTLFFGNFFEYFEILQTQCRNLYTPYFILDPKQNKKSLTKILLKKPFNLKTNRFGTIFTFIFKYFEILQTQWQTFYILHSILVPGPIKK